MDIPFLTPQRRDAYLRILDNQPDFHPIAQRLYFLEDHFPPDKLDNALKWLVRNDLVGLKFLAWYSHLCAGSDLEMHRLLLAVVANMELAPVIAGRNFKL